MLFDEFKDEERQVCGSKCLLCGSVARVGVSRGGTCGHHDVFEPQGHCGKIICLCSTFISAFITTTTTALVWTDSRVIQGLSPQTSHHLKTGVFTQQCRAVIVLPFFLFLYFSTRNVPDLYIFFPAQYMNDWLLGL